MASVAPTIRHTDMSQPTTEGKNIIDVAYRECRFPVGERDAVTMFCAKKTAAGETYCAEHTERMYAQRKPTGDRPFLLPK